MRIAQKNVGKATVFYRPGTSDEQVIRDVFDHQYHVPPVGPPPRSILDLGANIGLTMLHYRQLYPDAEIMGVEMDAENVAVAYRNTADPVLCAAVNGAVAISRFNPHTEPWAYSIADPGLRVTITAPLETFWPGRRFDLLKMDIEGSEATVLPDSDLGRFRSVIVETHGGYTQGDAARDLRRQGFRTRIDLPHPRAVYAWRGQ